MARALAWRVQEADPSGDQIAVTLSTIFYGSDVPDPISYPVTFLVADADGLAAMRDKAVDAVMAKGQELGLAMARTRVVIPSLARGA